jgi:hypothetical protein
MIAVRAAERAALARAAAACRWTGVAKAASISRSVPEEGAVRPSRAQLAVLSSLYRADPSPVRAVCAAGGFRDWQARG